jgi:hypothetical protein
MGVQIDETRGDDQAGRVDLSSERTGERSRISDLGDDTFADTDICETPRGSRLPSTHDSILGDVTLRHDRVQ